MVLRMTHSGRTENRNEATKGKYIDINIGLSGSSVLLKS